MGLWSEYLNIMTVTQAKLLATTAMKFISVMSAYSEITNTAVLKIVNRLSCRESVIYFIPL